jgi:type II secretory pathway component GspD/PulD (secretin)
MKKNFKTLKKMSLDYYYPCNSLALGFLKEHYLKKMCTFILLTGFLVFFLNQLPLFSGQLDSMSMIEDDKNLYLIVRSHTSLANFKTNLLSENVFVVDIANTIIPESEIKYVKREPLDFIKVWQYDKVRQVTRVMLKLTRQANVNLKLNDLGNELSIAVSKDMVSTIFSSASNQKNSIHSLNSHPGSMDSPAISPEFTNSGGNAFSDSFNRVNSYRNTGNMLGSYGSGRPGSKNYPGSGSYQAPFKMADPWAVPVKEQKKVTFKFSEYELGSILEFMSDALDSTILIDNSVDAVARNKKISVYVKDLGIKDALKLVLDTNDLAYKKFDDKTYIVITKDKADEDKNRIERVFQLINAKPEDLISVIRKSKSLAEKINVENLSIDKRTNSLLAFDTPEKIDMLTQVINKLDRKEKQVQIDMKLVEISRASGKQLGIKYDDAITITNISDMPTRLPLTATISALAEQNKAKVLASPRIRALHQKSASIKIGETIPVPFYELLNSTSGDSENTNFNVRNNLYNSSNSSSSRGNVDVYNSEGYAIVKNFKDIDVGIILNVKPFIHDDNEITLDLDIEVSSVVDITQEGQVHKQKRETKTTVRVGDGETAVLGGMIKDNERSRRVDVPFLGSIPGLGRLFQHHIKDVESTEMIMFITPHLVNVEESEEREKSGFEFARKKFLESQEY